MLYSVVYYFEVKKGAEKEFVQAWKKLTELIYEYEGSLGSRLHISDKGEYIAYAQWPSQEVFDKAPLLMRACSSYPTDLS